MSSDHNFIDVAFGREYAKLLIKTPDDVAVGRDTYESTSKSRTISTGDLATVEHEFFTLGYPVFWTPIQDLENAYQRAYQQLSTLKQGRYAYARDWNVLADYAKAIINALVDQLRRLIIVGNYRYIDVYGVLLQCQRILSTYKYLKSGDVIMPGHTNTLIDVAECLEFAIMLLLTRAVVKRREVDTAVGLDQTLRSRSEVDTARGLDTNRRPFLIVLVDTDDWETASQWITDGTIVFANYGTTAMTPNDVHNIVQNKEVVFAVLIDTQPVYAASTGAFYNVFYTGRNPGACALGGLLTITDQSFLKNLGFTICDSYNYIYRKIDFLVSKSHKRSDVITYANINVNPDCGYAYLKYEKGAIIELPYDGAWTILNQLDWYVGAIAHILLGESSSCYIADNNVKLKRIVWMAGYGTTMPEFGPGRCPTADTCLRRLADRSNWVLLDLRRHR